MQLFCRVRNNHLSGTNEGIITQPEMRAAMVTTTSQATTPPTRDGAGAALLWLTAVPHSSVLDAMPATSARSCVVIRA